MTEGQLKRVIKESVKRVLREYDEDDWRDIEGVDDVFIPNDEDYAHTYMGGKQGEYNGWRAEQCE